MNTIKEILHAFRSKFQKEPTVVVQANGRINLIGEHTDYNQGYVLPGAVDKYLYFAMSLQETPRLSAVAVDINEELEVETHALQPGPKSWANYLMGIIQQFQKLGAPIKGIQCVFGGNIPIGAGMSSSAALESGFGMGLSKLYGMQLSGLEIAQLSQRSSNEFIGVPTGIMDQFSSLMGKDNRVFKLDCGTMEHEYFPFISTEYDLVLVNSKVSHALEHTAYRDRVEECQMGLAVIRSHFLQVETFKDVTKDMLNKVEPYLMAKVYNRCRYVVEENERVIRATRALLSGDFITLGRLMNATHAGLRDLYEVSCPEIDFLVQFAQLQPEVLGARIMGGGFGGVTINLVQKSSLELFKAKIQSAYPIAWGIEPDVIKVSLVDGTHVLDELPLFSL